MIERQLTQADVDDVFERDGSFRDLFATGMTRATWRTLCEHLENLDLAITGQAAFKEVLSNPLVAHVASSLAFDEPASGILLDVNVFDLVEFEITIDPSDVDDVDDMMNILRFASDLGDVLEMELRLAPEGQWKSVVGTYVPMSRIWSFQSIRGEPYEVRV